MSSLPTAEANAEDPTTRSDPRDDPDRPARPRRGPVAVELGAFAVLNILLYQGIIGLDVPAVEVPVDGGHVVRPIVHAQLALLLTWAWVSLRLRGLRWRDVGLRRAGALTRRGLVLLVAATAIGVVANVAAGGNSAFGPVQGNVWLLVSLLYLALWAGVAEELVFRGFLITRAADLTGRSIAGWVAASALSALLFGVGHQYLGLAGLLTATIAGGGLGAALYFLNRRNLWIPIAAHVAVNSLLFVMLYLGVID